jgi:K(+)-stimulated pyrophosphate-energized sodium pump
MENYSITMMLLAVGSTLSLAVAVFLYFWMKKQDEGSAKMIEIASHVREGSWAYLAQQYKVVAPVFIVIAGLFAFLAYGLGIQNGWVPFAFLTGGIFSGLAGFLGMKTATHASSRVTQGASESLNKGLTIAFRSGAVMGLTVVGLALLDIVIWLFVLVNFVTLADGSPDWVTITTTMLTFGMGASTQALFARVGGGIFTKAADVGADTVGKVEAGIPEDDPRNPATIADNVGDNVGDVAGMGADLYESFAGAILATMALGSVAFMAHDTVSQFNAIATPILLAVLGSLLSIVGIFLVKAKEDATQHDLLKALGRGVNIVIVLFLIGAWPVINWLMGPEMVWGLWGSVTIGLATGWIIGKSTEYYTSGAFKPVKGIKSSSSTGPATVIINGMGVGNISTAIPIIVVAMATVFAYLTAAGDIGHGSINIGLYGIGMAAVGMLSTLGFTLATDAYGPIADNAGGNAQMANLDPEVRRRTDLLDSMGNTTAATGKGFAIGSAALTALALLAAYVEEVKIAMSHAGQMIMTATGEIEAASASLYDVMQHFNVHPFNPKVLFGMLLGVGMVFLFSGLTMQSVGRSADKMVQEVRRQFREIVGLKEGKAQADYAACVAIATKAAQQEMILPSLLAISVPIAIGIIFDVGAVIGLLIGTIISGFPYAIFMANAGGAWDNAKKLIEEEGEKGSAYEALVVGDTVGDPLKDTSGPSINILIKLMAMTSIAVAGVTVAFTLIK